VRQPIRLPESAGDVGTIRFTSWICQGGVRVYSGQAIAEIETDKTTVELESPADGVLVETLARPGDEITSETTLGFVESDPEQ
jgi:pyruvate/2-oxoglutarate dehydrogenase complex dihydrolipoamide acyltransferase (E2) component